jgi:hypothetical protein
MCEKNIYIFCYNFQDDIFIIKIEQKVIFSLLTWLGIWSLVFIILIFEKCFIQHDQYQVSLQALFIEGTFCIG